MIRNRMRAISLALVWTALAAAAAAGCRGSAEERSAGAPAAGSRARSASGAENVWAMPEMQRAREHRDRGARLLARAYEVRPGVPREARFDEAEAELRAAQQSYQRALERAAPVHAPVIEGEIEQVQEYLRQIHRDRAPPRGSA